MALDKNTTSIKATYSSPDDSKEVDIPITYPFPSPEDADYPRSKSAFIGDVRSQTKKLQDQINVFLTQKMEEDKVKTASGATLNGTGARPVNEDAEEESYGEEKTEDD